MQVETKFIEGGVCAPDGFTANGIHCGLKSSRTTNDLALIFCDTMCASAGLFTSNRVKAECVKLTQKNIADGKMQAAICNVCFANACTGSVGYENAERMAQAAASSLGLNPQDVIVCSTGIIGQHIPVEEIEQNVPLLVKGLSKENHVEARSAIMTTDTHFKECAVETEIGGKKIRIGGMCKGSGMIHINMGTMLSFLTTDCAITSQMLRLALKKSAVLTYNCVSVDGDTSTNDTLTIMASGKAGNAEIATESEAFDQFLCALNKLNTVLAMKIAADGEGASRLVECTVRGAKSEEIARGIAKAVIKSNLVKAAMFGRDANCGRILCAMGYSGFDFTAEKTCVYFSSRQGSLRFFDEQKDFQIGSENDAERIEVIHDGVGLSFDEAKAERILSAEAVEIEVVLQDGNAQGKAWGCDLTYDYVKINGDYRS